MRIITNVEKFASGGASAWASYIPITNPAQTSGGTSSGEGEQSLTLQAPASGLQLLDDKEKQFLREKALASDVEQFCSLINGMTSSMDALVHGAPSVSLQYQMIMQYLPLMRQEKERWDNAMKDLSDKDALNEIAVAYNGAVLVQGKDGKTSMKNLKEVDRSQEHILTNGEVANLRANQKTGAFNSSLTNILANGTSLKEIDKFIKEQTEGMGSNKTSYEGFVGSDGNTITKGAAVLQKLGITAQEFMAYGSIDGLLSAKHVNENLKAQAAAALSSIMGTLSKGALTVLQNRADEMSERTGKEITARDLVGLMIAKRTSSTDEISYTIQGDFDSTGSKRSTSADGKDGSELDPAAALALGKGDLAWADINPGTGTTFRTLGIKSYLVDGLGNGIQNTLGEATAGQMKGVLDFKNVTMGNARLTQAQLNNVAIKDNQIVGVDMPLDMAAYLKSGIIRPDVDMCKRKSEADDYIRKHNITNKLQIALIYAAHDVRDPLTQGNTFRRFAVVSAYAPETAFADGNDPASGYVQKVKDDNLKTAVEAQIQKGGNTKFKLGTGLFSDDLYEGNVYIPIISNYINATLGSGSYMKLPKLSVLQVEEETYRKNHAQEAQNAHKKADKLKLN